MQEKEGGLRLSVLNKVIAVGATVLALLLLINMLLMQNRYRDLTATTENYIRAQQLTSDLQAASDYLTARVRVFVMNGDVQSAEDFCREVEETRRRDNAVAGIREITEDSQAYTHLNEALRLSNKLAQIEVHAMRLAAQAYGMDLSQLPEMVQKEELLPEEVPLADEEQLATAQRLVFDDTYLTYKQQITDNVSQATQRLVDGTRERQSDSSRRLQALIRMQGFLIAVTFLAAVAVVLANNRLVIRPLMESVDHVRRGEPIPQRGAYEMRFVASNYNEVFDQSEKRQEQLAYEASHDALTGLYNRGAYEKFLAEHRKRREALLIVDVDRFKGVNDTYGHEVGDRILQRVARTLEASFRSEDKVCRIGGDEFVVLMTHAGPELTDLILRKTEQMTEQLSRPEDGLPAVTLSIGCAFGGGDVTGDQLYRNADSALYAVKESGRSGCEFYGEGTGEAAGADKADRGPAAEQGNAEAGEGE